MDDLKLPDTNPANGRRVEYINFDALSAPKVISIAGYDKYIENIELIVYEQDLKEYQVESANFDSDVYKRQGPYVYKHMLCRFQHLNH